MKKLLFIFSLLLSLPALTQRPLNYFQGGIEASIAFTTIQPYQEYYGFFDKLENGKTSQPRAGIFVNRFLSPNHQLEFGFYYTERGTAYCKGILDKLPIISGGDCNGKSLNYIELSLAHYYYPGSHSDFSYLIGIGYYQLLNETEDDENDFYENYDIEATLGIRFKFKKYHFLRNNLFLFKFDWSVLPISIDRNIELYNETANIDRFPQARNYAITLSIQHYL